MAERTGQDEAPAECSEIRELLPVHLNRSLDEEATRRIEAHLASCFACRQEERDTRTVLALHDGHLPVELIIGYAFEEPMPARRREVVESHLAACPRCAEEVATVRRKDTSAADAPEAAPEESDPQEREPDLRGLRNLAWAACIVAAVAATGWFLTWRQLADERTVGSAPAARANVEVVELLPATHTLLRQAGSEPRATTNRVQLPRGAGELVLVLLSGGGWCESACTLEIFEAGQAQPKRQIGGLVASPDGHLTLALPADWLSPERSVLAVYEQGSGELVAEYLVEPATP